jgi:hypothetical protein
MLNRSSTRMDMRVYPCFAHSELTSSNRELPGSGRVQVGVLSCIHLGSYGDTSSRLRGLGTEAVLGVRRGRGRLGVRT